MTFEEAKKFAARLPNCQGFTYESQERYPTEPVRVWFKSRLNILYNDDWWSWSTGRGMQAEYASAHTRTWSATLHEERRGAMSAKGEGRERYGRIQVVRTVGMGFGNLGRREQGQYG